MQKMKELKGRNGYAPRLATPLAVWSGKDWIELLCPSLKHRFLGSRKRCKTVCSVTRPPQELDMARAGGRGNRPRERKAQREIRFFGCFDGMIPGLIPDMLLTIAPLTLRERLERQPT